MIPLNPKDPISTLIEVPVPEMSDEEIERHDIFMLLTLTLVYENWCITKDDPEVVKAYKKFDPEREFSEYVGHNIGALLVAPSNDIIAYSFNCNHLYNNSTEHAEARVVRKGLRHYNRLHFKSGEGLHGYSSILKGHTVYTSLESCSQCCGIMDLANVSKVIYAQDDLGQGRIGNVLYNYHKNEGDYGASLPIRAKFLPIFSVIEKAWKEYSEFREGAAELSSQRRPGTAEFLRSIIAYKAYREAVYRFENYNPEYENNKYILKNGTNFRNSSNSISFRDASLGE